jgi:hypothetical protein
MMMSLKERDDALVYFATGEGEKPPYAALRALIGVGLLTAAGTLTKEGENKVLEIKLRQKVGGQ